MLGFFSAIIDAIVWLAATGWKVWSDLFAWVPYGDPYAAIAAAVVVCYVAHRIIYPDSRIL